MPMTLTTVLPAYASPVVQELFESQPFKEQPLPNLALMPNPAVGFEPTRLPNGIDVRFISNPAQLGIPLGAQLTPVWGNGLGLVLFRHEALKIFGAISIHSAIKNPWSAIGKDALQCLGGIMVFDDSPAEAKSVETVLDDVLRKGEAMTDKWHFIDMLLEEELQHPMLTNLGGGKAIVTFRGGQEARRDAINITAFVAACLGIYISGSDEGMTTSLCTYFSQLAPRNFMGAKDHPDPTYGGMGDPSPWTAKGTFESIEIVRQEVFNGEYVPIFIQGYGNVASFLVKDLKKADYPISGIAEARIESLIKARQDGIQVSLFLVVPEGAAEPDQAVLKQHDITVVRNLQEALSKAPETVLFSPNARPHPVSMELAEFLATTKVKAIVGATNNVLDTHHGSIVPIALFLQEHGIYCNNDSETNQTGAFSVTTGRIVIPPTMLRPFTRAVGARQHLAVQAFKAGQSPQLARWAVAVERHNKMLREGRAIGGFRTITP